MVNVIELLEDDNVDKPDVLNDLAAEYLTPLEIYEAIELLEEKLDREVEKNDLCPACYESYLGIYETHKEGRGEHFGFPAKETVLDTLKCPACGYVKEV